MISQKKLAYYEYVASQTCNAECKKVITQLVSEVRKLNAEADWLAGQLADYCKADNDYSCHDKTRNECIRCKFEEAKKATSHD